METSYITRVLKQFNYYKTIGDKTLEQLSFEDMVYQPKEASNSISIIVKHMVGNMFSRWTNFLTEDGEKEWRQRDQEFEPTYKNKEELIEAWEMGWNCLFEAIRPLTDEDLTRIVYIRNEGHSVFEAIFRQLGHYPYHIGQIAYIGKIVKGNAWKSLSIPKGASTTYNKEKFSQDKDRCHFSDKL